MGTAILRVMAMSAGKDAWLAILLGTAGGLAIFWIYVSLYRLYPELPLTGYIRAILGKGLGWPLGLLYILFFIHGGARDLREGGDLLISSVMEQTPIIVVNAVMVLSIVYVLNKGIEVVARTAQIFIMTIAILGFLSIFLLLFAGVIDISRLLPVMGNGLGPVIQTTLKQTIEFPHEEVICFAMLLPYLNNREKGIRAGFAAVLTSGLLLSFSTALNIAVLGIDIAGRSTFPLLSTIRLINIGEIIQRLDVFVVLTLIVGDFFKVAIFFYAAVLAAADLFRIKDYRQLVLPIGIIILFVSMMISSSFIEQIEEGDVLLVTVFLWFGVLIPIFLLAAAGVRKWFGSRP